MIRPVNYKAILVFLAAAVAAGVAVHFVHGYQVRRNAGALREDARRAEEEGRPAEAADYLEQYLGMVPGEADAQARYGLLLQQLAKDWPGRVRAYLALSQALRLDPSRNDVRREVARLALQVREFNDACEKLSYLLEKAQQDDAEVLQLLGRAAAGNHKLEEAVNWYGKASKAVPRPGDPKKLEQDRADRAVEYAAFLRAHQDKDLGSGDMVMGRLAQSYPKSVPAQLAAARHFRQTGDAKAAFKYARQAVDTLGARDADALLLAAQTALSAGQGDDARAWLKQGHTLHPDDGPLARALARAEGKDGHREQALRLLGPALRDLPTRAEDLFDLAAVLTDLGEKDRAEDVLRHLPPSAPWVTGYVRGRLLAQAGAWGEARDALEKARTAGALPLLAVRQVNFLLAECYQRLDDPDRQLQACRRALEEDATWPPARRLLAAALAATGQTDQAVAEYRALAKTDPDAGLDLARLLLARTLRQPPAGRSWAEVEQALAKLTEGKSPQDKSPQVAAARLLRARVRAAQGDMDKARELAQKELDLDPKQVGPWLLLATLADRPDDGKAVLAVLDDAERATGPRVEWELARAAHWVRTDRTAAPAELRKLEQRADRLPEADRDRLREGLAGAYAAVGAAADAERLWAEVARRQPNNAAVRFQLFERALAAGQGEEARRLLGELRRLDGDGGMAAYGEAAVLLWTAPPGDRAVLAEAHRLLARAAEARPSWGRVPLLEAQVYERENQPSRALECYQAATERGEGRLFVVQRRLALLQQLHRYAEADALLRRLPAAVQALPELSRREAELTLLAAANQEDPVAARKQALELARQAVAKGSKSVRDYLWLGQVSALAGEPEGAVRAFRQARDLDDKNPAAWAALILFLAGRDAAAADAEMARARGRLPQEKLPFVLAAGYEALGKPDQAAAEYAALVAARPTDAQALAAAADFYGRAGRKEEAERLLGKLVDRNTAAPADLAARARRALALSLAVGGNYRRFHEALRLLGGPDEKAPDDPADRRLWAVLLATRPEHRRDALRQFEELSARREALPPDARFVMAQLYEADGNWAAAREQLLGLLSENGNNRSYLAYFVQALLRHGQADEAGEWVKWLEKAGAPAFEVTDLRARALQAQGKSGEAVELVRAYTREKDARLDLAGLLLDRLGQPAAAEAAFRAHAAASKEPTAALLLAQHLAGQKRVREALDLADPARAKCSPLAVGQLCQRLLRSPGLSDEQRQRVEGWLVEAARRQPGSAYLAVALAEMHDLHGRPEEAVRIYRDLLRQSPNNVLALNNLACLLALTGGSGDEALRLIEAAIEEAGPLPEFLDSRALVRLRRQEPDRAIADLQQAVAQAPLPGAYFHLAQAQRAVGNRDAAQTALRKSVKELNLRPEDLPPLERDTLRGLQQELEVPAKSPAAP